MGVLGKMEVEVEIKSSGDVFHQLFRNNFNHIPNITPHKFQVFDVLEGESTQPGSLLECKYVIDGENCASKVIIEEIDEEKKMIKYKNIEGSTLEDYKSFIATMEVKDKGDTSVVKWTMEFEKIEDNGPYPTKFIDFMIGVTRDIETHHLNA